MVSAIFGFLASIVSLDKYAAPKCPTFHTRDRSQEHYELSNNTFDVSDILSASKPMDWYGTGIKRPADSGMIDFWNEAIEKYRKQGKPGWKEFEK